MATLAQVKRDRQAQLGKLSVAMRHYDAAQEALERLIKRYKAKRKVLEAGDLPALNAAFRNMNDKFGGMETELTNLARIVGAI
jgi:hypothetical protein